MSHKLRSISENFCDYHGTWLSSRYNHRNFQTWVITTELSGHDVSRGNLWDTVRHRETLPPAVLYMYCTCRALRAHRTAAHCSRPAVRQCGGAAPGENSFHRLTVTYLTKFTCISSASRSSWKMKVLEASNLIKYKAETRVRICELA